MSKCDFHLAFEREDRTYCPGDEIVGAVKVAVNKECTSRRIFIRNKWRTHGRGNTASGESQEIDLAKEEKLLPGDDKMIAFRFTAPAGPVTYHGKLLNVDWYTRVQMDVPWAIDPKKEEEFILLADPNAPSDNLCLGDERWVNMVRNRLRRHKEGAGRRQTRVGIAVGTTLALIGLAVMSAGFMGGLAVPPLIFGAVALLIGGVVTFACIRNSLAEKKLGQVVVDVQPQELHSGGDVEAAIRFNPTREASIEYVSTTLRCQEVVVSGSGTNRHTYRETLLEKEQRTEQSDLAISQGEALVRHRHAIGRDSPPSFHADDNDINWTIEVRISVRDWPDWKESYPLIVRP